MADAPPFPPEVVDGWAVQWLRQDGAPMVDDDGAAVPRTLLVLVADQPGRKRVRARLLIYGSTSPEALGKARELLLAAFREHRDGGDAACPFVGVFNGVMLRCSVGRDVEHATHVAECGAGLVSLGPAPASDNAGTDGGAGGAP